MKKGSRNEGISTSGKIENKFECWMRVNDMNDTKGNAEAKKNEFFLLNFFWNNQTK